MKNTELIRLLFTFPLDADVIISKDEEGNGFNELEEVEYSAIERWDGEIDVLQDEDVEEDGDYERVIVLWP